MKDNDITWRRFKAPFIALLLSLAPDAWAADAPLPDLPSKSFPQRVAESLGIPNNHSEILVPIGTAAQSVNGDPKATGEALNSLVTALLAGPDPNALIDEILPVVHVYDLSSGFQEIPTWKYGTYSQRLFVAQAIGRLVDAAEKRDATKATDFAKAYIMFCAMNDFKDGSLGAAAFLKDQGRENRLLALPGAQLQQLNDLLAERAKEHEGYWDDQNSAGESIDRLTEAPGGAVDLDEVQNALRHIDSAYHRVAGQDGYRFSTTWYAWSLLNLVESRKSDAAAAKVRELLESWKKLPLDADAIRWIDEALVKRGPVPTKMAGHQVVIIKPDGSRVLQSSDLGAKK